MAVQTITIDERIKCVGDSSVFDYGGTIYVLDNNGLKFFNGSELELINALQHQHQMNAILVDDFIYYMNDYYLCRYNITTNTFERLSQVSSTSRVYYDMFYYNNKIFVVSFVNSTRDSYYTEVYDLETSSFDTAKSLGFSYSGSGNLKVQVAVVGDVAYFRAGRYLRAYNLPDLTSYVSYTADDLADAYLTGAYVYEREYVSTLGYKSGYKNRIYSFNLDTLLGEEKTLNIPADSANTGNHFVGVWDDTYCIATPSGLIKIKYVTYDLTYNFYDFNGKNMLVNLTGKYPIYKVLFNKSENSISYTLTTIDGIISGAFDYEAPQDKQITGIALKARSKRPTFSFGVTYDISINESTNFYLSEGTYRSPETTFDVNLYQNSAEVNRVDKGRFLVGVGTLSGALRDECSMLTPSIVYQSSDVPNFNYVYIPIFNRYYFVTSLSSVSKNVWRMELNCDVLMTYKNEILLLQGVVGRQEFDFNPMLVDSEIPTQDNPEVEIINIPSTAFLSHTNITGNLYNFVLTVIG